MSLGKYSTYSEIQNQIIKSFEEILSYYMFCPPYIIGRVVGTGDVRQQRSLSKAIYLMSQICRLWLLFALPCLVTFNDTDKQNTNWDQILQLGKSVFMNTFRAHLPRKILTYCTLPLETYSDWVHTLNVAQICIKPEFFFSCKHRSCSRVQVTHLFCFGADLGTFLRRFQLLLDCWWQQRGRALFWRI